MKTVEQLIDGILKPLCDEYDEINKRISTEYESAGFFWKIVMHVLYGRQQMHEIACFSNLKKAISTMEMLSIGCVDGVLDVLKKFVNILRAEALKQRFVACCDELDAIAKANRQPPATYTRIKPSVVDHAIRQVEAQQQEMQQKLLAQSQAGTAVAKQVDALANGGLQAMIREEVRRQMQTARA